MTINFPLPSQWGKMTAIRGDIDDALEALRKSWPVQMPGSLEQLEAIDELACDLADIVNHLGRGLLWLKGFYSAVSLPAPAEQTNENGDIIRDITPGTAPCSEIATSLGVSTAKIVALARRLKLKPAGLVKWELANGDERSARTFDLQQWRELRDWLHHDSNLFGTVMPEPPARLKAFQDGCSSR